jgi:hypothetical protein
LYSKGAYHSFDLDFVLVGPATLRQMDTAMKTVGFARKANRYAHPRVRFFVEFPPGPLAVGGDYRIRPVARIVARRRMVMLSATDSCRDRLAAFYHWNDRQSLSVAVWIALRNRVGWRALRRWSLVEGAAAGFAEFEAELQRARMRLSSSSAAPRRGRRSSFRRTAD